MEIAVDVMDRVRDALGGGTLSVWLVLGGLIATFLAYKAVKLVVKLAALATAAVLFLGTAPWASQPVEGDAARCAAAVVEEGATGWQTHLTKRTTVEELSSDARCRDGGVGLAGGRATVKLRTFWDVPFQTWEVTPDGAEANIDVPELTSS